MDKEKTFGAYIQKKRLEAGLTRKELAGLLCVTESSVSEWERGLSCPDMSLIPAICQKLDITEHEFLTACDEAQDQEQVRQALVQQQRKQRIWLLFALGYAVAAVACFVCDLAIFHALDWFWIVLASLALAFSFTNLPVLVRRERAAVCLGAASGCLLLLLLACWRYTGEWWVLGGGCVTGVCLTLPWSWWAIGRFYGRNAAPLCMGAFSLWVPLLLAVICFFDGGDWLLGFAYPIAAFCLVYLWLCFGAVCWLPVGGWLRAAAVSFLTALTVPLGNTLSAWMVSGQHTPVLPDSFAWGSQLLHQSVSGFSWVNMLVFAILLGISAVLLVIGTAAELRRRKGA